MHLVGLYTYLFLSFFLFVSFICFLLLAYSFPLCFFFFIFVGLYIYLFPFCALITSISLSWFLLCTPLSYFSSHRIFLSFSFSSLLRPAFICCCSYPFIYSFLSYLLLLFSAFLAYLCLSIVILSFVPFFQLNISPSSMQ